MHLADKGSPDLIACVNGLFYGIEVKKDEKEKEKWLKLLARYQKGETLPKSYHRELAQIQCSEMIDKTQGRYILACCVDDVKKVIK